MIIKLFRVNKVGNTLKFISGIILFVIGILIAYGATIYNLVDILLMVGFLISIVGVILIISYFVDSNADKTTSVIKEFLNSKDFDSSSINFPKRGSRNGNSNFESHGPLRMQSDYDDDDIDNSGLWEYYESENNRGMTPREYFDSDVDESKAVLRVVNREEKDMDLDQLNFTPTYDKPIKVDRKPKKRSKDYFNTVEPQFEESIDKSEEIKRALSQDNESVDISSNVSEPQGRDIEIDVNHPEKLPVPKLLRSNILSAGGIVSSNDAFDQLAVHVNKEIMLEIPSLNTLSDRFLSHVPTIYSRVIIDEFDLSDISYTFLIASLLKQGVHIKTVPKVHSVNLITDDSHAMIISDDTINDSEYGAIYDDRMSISNIRADFERTWNIASNLDENTILNSIAGGAA